MHSIFISVPSLLMLLAGRYQVSGQVIALGKCPNPPAMPDFDISKYHGLWYEVEKYWFIVQAASSCVRVQYFDKIGNETTFKVEIKQIEGRKKETVNPGTTFFNSNDGSADLTLDLVITQSPIPFTVPYRYLVLHTDYENYTIKWACRQVGPLSIQNMWILSRQKFLKKRGDVYSILKTLGINTQMLKKSDLSTCPTKTSA